jgi:hypothetical protein
MMPNKRNMLLETIACLFLFPRQDVFQGQRLTSEANEHTYGLWRMILREFNMEQLIRIVQKAIIKNDAMFESNFDAFRSNTMQYEGLSLRTARIHQKYAKRVLLQWSY